MRTKDGILYFPSANYAGEGFDIYGKYDVQNSSITPLFDPLKAGTHSFYFLGQEYALPDYIQGAESTSAYYREDTATTRESFQNSIATNCEVHASYGAFSGQMEASYGRQFASNSSFSYSYRNFFSSMGKLEINLDRPERFLTDYFLERVAGLPDRVTGDNLQLFADFFDDFGIYFVSELVLGGSIEYYVAVSNSSQMTSIDISESVKVEYKALFASGGVSIDTKTSQKWQTYTANRNVQILGKGGDPTLLARVTSADPDQPGDISVGNYNMWLDSIKTNPAVVDFKLKGIWNLCGNKRVAVESAFHEYGRNMRPRLVIQTNSINGYPTITLGSDIRPVNPPEHPYGFQMVILDRGNVSPGGVKLNKYYGFEWLSDDWFADAMRMYEEMMNDVRWNGYDNPDNVLILASYTLQGGATPPNNFYGLLRSAGGSTQLFNWLDRAFPGIWGDFVAYTQVGVFGFGPDTGVDAIAWEPYGTTLEVFFYRQAGDTRYTLGMGGSTINKVRKPKKTKKVKAKEIKKVAPKVMKKTA